MSGTQSNQRNWGRHNKKGVWRTFQNVWYLGDIINYHHRHPTLEGAFSSIQVRKSLKIYLVIVNKRLTTRVKRVVLRTTIRVCLRSSLFSDPLQYLCRLGHGRLNEGDLISLFIRPWETNQVRKTSAQEEYKGQLLQEESPPSLIDSSGNSHYTERGNSK